MEPKNDEKEHLYIVGIYWVYPPFKGPLGGVFHSLYFQGSILSVDSGKIRRGLRLLFKRRILWWWLHWQRCQSALGRAVDAGVDPASRFCDIIGICRHHVINEFRIHILFDVWILYDMNIWYMCIYIPWLHIICNYVGASYLPAGWNHSNGHLAPLTQQPQQAIAQVMTSLVH